MLQSQHAIASMHTCFHRRDAGQVFCAYKNIKPKPRCSMRPPPIWGSDLPMRTATAGRRNAAPKMHCRTVRCCPPLTRARLSCMTPKRAHGIWYQCHMQHVHHALAKLQVRVLLEASSCHNEHMRKRQSHTAVYARNHLHQVLDNILSLTFMSSPMHRHTAKQKVAHQCTSQHHAPDE